MKIRIQGNSIRLRLSQSEVTKFHETGSVSDSISFGGILGAKLSYSLERTDMPDMSATFDNNQISVFVPTELGVRWATSVEEVGMEHLQRVAAIDEALRILVEKDFKCLAERPDADESDNFPNPNLSC
ncbi:MAG: hypothetical protein GC192_04135 [Bacteroidetes bacterium]|nr:hypothetical protein [Bacteroidota bacterium]